MKMPKISVAYPNAACCQPVERSIPRPKWAIGMEKIRSVFITNAQNNDEPTKTPARSADLRNQTVRNMLQNKSV